MSNFSANLCTVIMLGCSHDVRDVLGVQLCKGILEKNRVFFKAWEKSENFAHQNYSVGYKCTVMYSYIIINYIVSFVLVSK